MKVLELFSGTECISNAFRKRGHECFTIDWDEQFPSSLHCDIGKLKASDILKRFGKPDVIFCAFDCTTFSVASISKHRRKNEKTGNFEPISDYARYCDRVDRHVLKLIKELNPKIYIIENPRGALRCMNFMKGIPRYTTTYCQYGFKYMKPTDFFSNIDLELKPPCKNGDSCHTPAPRGTQRGLQAKEKKLRSVYPSALCRHIVDVCEKKISQTDGSLNCIVELINKFMETKKKITAKKTAKKSASKTKTTTAKKPTAKQLEALKKAREARMEAQKAEKKATKAKAEAKKTIKKAKATASKVKASAKKSIKKALTSAKKAVRKSVSKATTTTRKRLTKSTKSILDRATKSLKKKGLAGAGDVGVVNCFVYYMYNKWSKEECIKIFGNVMGEHFWDKWNLYKGDVATFWANMSDTYRPQLIDRAIEVEGKYYLQGLAGAKQDDMISRLRSAIVDSAIRLEMLKQNITFSSEKAMKEYESVIAVLEEANQLGFDYLTKKATKSLKKKGLAGGW